MNNLDEKLKKNTELEKKFDDLETTMWAAFRRWGYLIMILSGTVLVISLTVLMWTIKLKYLL